MSRRSRDPGSPDGAWTDRQARTCAGPFRRGYGNAIRQRADAVARLAGYEPRLREAFVLQGELDEKLARLAEIEADLAKTDSILTNDQPDLTEGDGITQAA